MSFKVSIYFYHFDTSIIFIFRIFRMNIFYLKSSILLFPTSVRGHSNSSFIRNFQFLPPPPSSLLVPVCFTCTIPPPSQRMFALVSYPTPFLLQNKFRDVYGFMNFGMKNRGVRREERITFFRKLNRKNQCF